MRGEKKVRFVLGSGTFRFGKPEHFVLRIIHCGISTTEKYLHVFDRQKMDAVNSLGSIGYAMP